MKETLRRQLTAPPVWEKCPDHVSNAVPGTLSLSACGSEDDTGSWPFENKMILELNVLFLNEMYHAC